MADLQDSATPKASGNQVANPISESVCEACGGDNPVWFAPNELWNKVVQDEVHFLCPNCFIKLAEGTAIEAAWRLTTEKEAEAPNQRDPEGTPSIHQERIAEDILTSLCYSAANAEHAKTGFQVFESKELSNLVRTAQTKLAKAIAQEANKARIDELMRSADAHRLAGGKGLPKGFQTRMKQLTSEKGSSNG